MARPAFPGLPVMTAAAIAVCLALAGCAEMPYGGAPRADKADNQVQAYVLPEPPPPPTGKWSPRDVVLGFLHASANYAIDPSAARAYLVPGLRRLWDPHSVTVLAGSLQVTQLVYRGDVGGGPYKTVSFAGNELATLSPSGQYSYTPGRPTYTFQLETVNGVWLIDGLSLLRHRVLVSLLRHQVLLLTESDFNSVYQPRNLYFFAPQSVSAPTGTDLVPDPVYAPVEGSDTALNTTVAATLVRGLFEDSGSWLSNATWSAFPKGTKLGSLSFSGQTAVVNLVGTASRLESRQHAQQVQEMDEQLKATLTTASAYSAAVAHNVQLKIDGGSHWYYNSSTHLIPGISNAPEPAFFRLGQSGVAELRPGYKRPDPVVLPKQVAGQTITAIAEAPPVAGSQLAVAVQVGQGCEIYVGRLARRPAYQGFLLPSSGGTCTSVSWDTSGRIWAATARGIWVVQPFLPLSHAVVAVPMPDMPGTRSANYRILQLQMAPDGVRAALLIQPVRPGAHHGSQSPSGVRSVLLAAVANSSSVALGSAVSAGSGLPDLRSISWYDDYYLAALAGTSIYRVPLTGGASQLLGSAPLQAQTLSTDNSEFLVGTAGPGIMESSASALSWVRLASGAIPAYQG
jgi:hypothetical protein